MNSKNENGLDKIGKSVNLQLMLEKDINTLHSFSGEDLSKIDKSIHKTRKSLKSISAILLLYKVQFGKLQYLSSKSFIKTIAKQFGVVREPYVYLQTFNQIEDKLKEFDISNLDELRCHLELQYNLIVKDNKIDKERIQQGNESIVKLTETLNNFHVNFKFKPLKRRLLISFQKSKRLFKMLNLNSTAGEYHAFRKWCKIYYFQQAALNRIGSVKTSRKNKKLFKLTEYLGKEHDLQLFYQYLTAHFPELSQLSEALFRLKIKRIRKKVLMLYPKISY